MAVVFKGMIFTSFFGHFYFLELFPAAGLHRSNSYFCCYQCSLHVQVHLCEGECFVAIRPGWAGTELVAGTSCAPVPSGSTSLPRRCADVIALGKHNLSLDLREVTTGMYSLSLFTVYLACGVCVCVDFSLVGKRCDSRCVSHQ